MVIDNLGKQTQSVRNELGEEPSIHEIVRIRTENVAIPKLTVKHTSTTIGHSWIVGSSTNGIVGTNTNTQDGLQQVVGGAGKLTSISKVLNENNDFNEFFNYTSFKDTVNSTGGWDSTGVGTANIYPGEILQSLTVYQDTSNVISAKMNVDFNIGSAGLITAQMVAAGTAQPFETVTLNENYTFATAGNDLRWKITAIGTAEITKVRIEYNV